MKKDDLVKWPCPDDFEHCWFYGYVLQVKGGRVHVQHNARDRSEWLALEDVRIVEPR